MTTAFDKLKAFAIVPVPTIDANITAMVANGALLIPAAKIGLFRCQPGALVLCPSCYSYKNLDPVWDISGRSSSGFTCLDCLQSFANSEALNLIFGHLTNPLRKDTET